MKAKAWADLLREKDRLDREEAGRRSIVIRDLQATREPVRLQVDFRRRPVKT